MVKLDISVDVDVLLIGTNKIDKLITWLLDSGAGSIFVKQSALKHIKHKIEQTFINVNGRYQATVAKQIAVLEIQASWLLYIEKDHGKSHRRRQRDM